MPGIGIGIGVPFLRGDKGPVQLTIAYVATQFVFKWKAPAGSFLTFNNGNGTTSTVEGGDAVLKTHTTDYAGAGTFNFWITGDVTDLTYIDIQNQTFVSGDVSAWSQLTNLTTLACRTTGVSGDISGWSALTSLTILSCYNTSVSGDVSSWNTLTSLITVHCYGTSVTFDNTLAWNITATINLFNNGLTSQMVDNAIESLSTCTNCTIDISGTNAHRTAASNDDLNTLLANGNTITLNDTLGAEKITDGGFPDATNWDVTAPSWSIAAGVAAYDDLNDVSPIFQLDASMISGMADSTVYRIELDIANAATYARIYLVTANGTKEYRPKTSFTNGTNVIYFTSPSDTVAGGGGIAFYAYTVGAAFDLDDVSLKTVTLS